MSDKRTAFANLRISLFDLVTLHWFCCPIDEVPSNSFSKRIASAITSFKHLKMDMFKIILKSWPENQQSFGSMRENRWPGSSSADLNAPDFPTESMRPPSECTSKSKICQTSREMLACWLFRYVMCHVFKYSMPFLLYRIGNMKKKAVVKTK